MGTVHDQGVMPGDEAGIHKCLKFIYVQFVCIYNTHSELCHVNPVLESLEFIHVLGYCQKIKNGNENVCCCCCSSDPYQG